MSFALRKNSSFFVNLSLSLISVALGCAQSYAKLCQSIPLQSVSPAGPLKKLFNEGLDAIGRGDLATARRCFESVVRVNPQQAEAHNMLVWVLFAQGEIKPAITHLEQAVHLAPLLVEAHINLSRAFIQNQDGPAAVREARTAVKIAPRAAEPYHTLAHALEYSGDVDSGAAAIRRAIEIDPSNAEFHDD